MMTGPWELNPAERPLLRLLARKMLVASLMARTPLAIACILAVYFAGVLRDAATVFFLAAMIFGFGVGLQVPLFRGAPRLARQLGQAKLIGTYDLVLGTLIVEIVGAALPVAAAGLMTARAS